MIQTLLKKLFGKFHVVTTNGFLKTRGDFEQPNFPFGTQNV